MEGLQSMGGRERTAYTSSQCLAPQEELCCLSFSLIVGETWKYCPAGSLGRGLVLDGVMFSEIWGHF